MIAPWSDPVFADALDEARAHPWRTLAEACVLIACVAAGCALLAILSVAGS